MRIFKNGIDMKWFLLLIGIVAVSGIAIASVDPIISNTNSYLDNLYVTYLHGDISNVTGILPNASMPATAFNKSNSLSTEMVAGMVQINSSNDHAFNVGTHSGNITNTGFWMIGGKDFRFGSSDYDIMHGSYFKPSYGGSGGGVLSVGTRKTGVDTDVFNIATGVFSFLNLASATGTPDAVCLNGNEVKRNPAQTCTVSNASLKNIVGIVGKEEIDKFMQIPIYKFYWKTDTNNTTLNYGSTAQDIEKIFPNLARYDADGKIATYEVTELIVLAKAAIVQQQEQLNNQQYQINQLRYEIELSKGNKSAIAPTPIPISIPTTSPWYKFW